MYVYQICMLTHVHSKYWQQLHMSIVKQETFAVLATDKQATMPPLHARLPGDPRESTSTWAFSRLPDPLRRQKVLVSHARRTILNYVVAGAHFLARGLRSFSLFLFRLAALLDFWDFREVTLKASEKPRLPEAFFNVLRFLPSFCNRRASPERRCCSNFFKLVVLAKAFRAAAASLGQVDV